MARFTYFAVLVALVPTVLCCGKMNIELKEANTNCADGSVSVIQASPDFGFKLLDNCTLELLGCVKTTKDISELQMHSKFTANSIPISEDDSDGCELLKKASKSEDVDMVMSLFQIKDYKSCPIKAREVCTEGKSISLAKYQDNMMLTPGTLKGEITINHGAAGKSCIYFVVEVTSKSII